MSEQRAKQYLIDTYHASRLEQLTGGYTNQTYLLHGTAPLLVAKIASPFHTDMTVEARSLRLLEDTALTPALYE
ncbi:hypothetical protein [Marinococcus sp. PL1-022]|uniref:hypothetical protein n=1 Tax=Marinococcus sp. PL1-022 TaxID=3095363 RepID=UPI0029C3D23B|nr:hypothetical protein [Marinococcus sp. PL1-022]MDX6153104.1 hypothetical protein [Marinococcus sp. PL1-022]